MVVTKKRTFALIFTVVFVVSLSLLTFLIVPKKTFAEDMQDWTNCDYPGMNIPASYGRSTTTEGWSSVSSGAKISGDSAYRTSGVYAKPGDTAVFQHCYFPGAQKVAGQNVSPEIGEAGHIHTETISDASSTTIGITNNTLMNLTNNEKSSHMTLPDGIYGTLGFDDGPYAYIQNFSRVTNYAGYYGGFNIFDQTFTTGDYEIRSVGPTGNQYSVGRDGTLNHVGRFTETSKIVAPNYAKVEEKTCDSWKCKYTTTEDPLKTSSCQHETGEYHKKYMCSINGPPSVSPSQCVGKDPNKKDGCECLGYTWELQEDHNDPVIKYDNPCYVDHWVDCSHGNEKFYDLTVDTVNTADSPISSTAEVIVPYNYEIKGSIELADGPVYAGEKATLKKASVTINSRYNSSTKGTYATDAPLIKVKISTYVTDSPTNANTPYGIYNEGPEQTIKNDGSTLLYVPQSEWTFASQGVNVYDTQAGRYFCVKIKYYPSNSGASTNYSDVNGSGEWGISAPSCRIIAKRPSLQVWGGNLFSNGNIETSTAVKNNGDGLGYVVSGPNAEKKEKIYGSWGELGVTVLKNNTGFASGNSIYSADWEKHPNGGLIVDANSSDQAFCKKESILSFANFLKTAMCSNGSWQKTGNFGTGKRNVDKGAVVKEFIDDNTKTGCNGWANITGDHYNTGNSNPNNVSVINRVTVNDTVVKSLYCNGAIEFRGSNVGFGSTAGKDSIVREKGTTWIVRSDEDITIAGNITYDQTKGYKTFNSMQKLIIYSKKNINIKCDVTWIDAVLISEKKVRTCSNATSGDDNDARRNPQLRINGAIITDVLEPGRSYGSGGGVYPADPAEIINYDSTLLLWGRAQADVSESDKTYTTYTRELAPRY